MRQFILLTLVALLSPLTVIAQAPAGYYSGAKGKSGAALKTSLYGIVADHVQRSYSDLWEDFKSTDRRPDGSVWDGVTLGSLYVEAQGCVPVLLESLCGMSCSGTCWPLGGAWFQCRYGGF